MFRARYIISLLILLVLLAACTSAKNTSTTRWYHSFNTRYNVYYNGKLAYDEALKNQLENYQENYTETILMFPVSATPKDKQSTGGAFDKAIEKSVKAIKQHSIQTKPARKSGKRNNPKYKEFMSRVEYNPFLYNAWLLMAKSQFHNGDFLQASSSFSYISRLYATQPKISAEAKIWHARSYAEMEWYYEAEDMLAKIDSATINSSKDLRSMWETAKADVLIKQKRYDEAVPYMQAAIKGEKNKVQKEREKYLLGQMYTSLGQRELAYQTFGKISSARAPYVLEFSAKIRQTEVFPGGNTLKAVRQLEKMSKSSKNKDYLDQVYYALGNVYMTEPDTAKAIESYELGVEKSTRNGLDKALNQIQLGDIYFTQREYVKAQPNYSEALGFLKKGDDTYPRISKRSEVLDELVIFHEAVTLQDSLLRLSEMSEEEQLAIIDKIIKDLIKKEEEELKNAEREEYMAELEATRDQNRPSPIGTGMVTAPQDMGVFYFYNTQLVAKGKSEFQQKWGRRKLEDNWRRKDKSSVFSDSLLPDDQEGLESIEGMESEGRSDTDSLLADGAEGSEGAESGEVVELSTDPKDPEYYLQQIPKTEEDKQAAHLIIADGLFNMGVIYKDKLEDADLALETFEKLDTRYPENENKLEAYYHTFMIYLRQGNTAMANVYKQKIRSEFPESEYAVAMTDPEYEYNLKMMYVLQDSLYRDTYDAYLKGDIQTIKKNYETVTKKYPQTKLMPKFMFLNALSFVQTGESDKFKEELKSLMEKYPEADVSLLASEMMKGFQRGLSLSGDGMIARGGIFNLRLGGADEIIEDPSELTFSAEANAPHQLMLVYPTGLLDDNLLLYTVASYNFGNFQINDFDLEKVQMDPVSMLQIKTFNSLGQVLQYVRMIQEPEGYAQSLGPDVIILPISLENYATLMKGKSLNEYMTFFKEQYGKDNPKLVERWKLAEEEEADPGESEAEELLIDVDPEPDDDSQPEDIVEIIEEDRPVEVISIEPETVVDESTAEEEEVLVDDNDTTPVAEEWIEKETDKELKEEGESIITESWLEAIEDEQDPETIESEEMLTEETEEDPWATEEDKSNNIFNKLGKTIKDKLGVDLEDLLEPEEEEAEEEKKKKSNPIEEYVKEQETSEKERLKQEKEEQKQLEKEAKELKKQQEKEKKEAQKQKERDRKELQKQREQERKAKAKAREEERKLKEKTRKENQKLKEQERKEKAKAREEERKRKDRERKEAQRLKEQERKQKEAERKANKK